jgi:hypothetical protein
MKKIFLLLIIALWQLSCMAIELTEAEIMPKKLLFAELPEDYPPEINELFEFYYQTYKELNSRIDDINDKKGNHSILENYMSEFSHDEIKQFVYWEWLAKNHITEYFFEFIGLHYWLPLTRESSGDNWEALLPYAERIRSLLYYPEGSLHIPDRNSLLWLSSIRGSIYNRYKNEIHRSRLLTFSGSIRAVPLIGELVNITDISLGTLPSHLVFRDYQILEFNTGKEVKKILAPLSQISSLRNPELTIGKKYLILISRTTLPSKVSLERLLNKPIPLLATHHYTLVEDDVIRVKQDWSMFQYFFNVDNLDKPEQHFFDTPVDVFWERYNNFHKRILEGK